MGTRVKILLTITLAVLFWLVWDKADFRPASPLEMSAGQWYGAFNETYFNNRLPDDTEFSFDGTQDMARTTKLSDGRFKIQFNLYYLRAGQYLRLTELHEMCHIDTWDEKPDHGKRWGACMQRLNSMGAFKDLLIVQPETP